MHATWLCKHLRASRVPSEHSRLGTNTSISQVGKQRLRNAKPRVPPEKEKRAQGRGLEVALHGAPQLYPVKMLSTGSGREAQQAAFLEDETEPQRGRAGLDHTAESPHGEQHRDPLREVVGATGPRDGLAHSPEGPKHPTPGSSL